MYTTCTERIRIIIDSVKRKYECPSFFFLFFSFSPSPLSLSLSFFLSFLPSSCAFFSLFYASFRVVSFARLPFQLNCEKFTASRSHLAEVGIEEEEKKVDGVFDTQQPLCDWVALAYCSRCVAARGLLWSTVTQWTGFASSLSSSSPCFFSSLFPSSSLSLPPFVALVTWLATKPLVRNDWYSLRARGMFTFLQSPCLVSLSLGMCVCLPLLFFFFLSLSPFSLIQLIMKCVH